MKTSFRVFHWLPRIVFILAILFISVFALDSFAPGLTIWQQLAGFIIHLIPSFILIAILIIAWKHELIGGIIIAVTSILMSPLIFNLNHNRNHFSDAQSLFNVLIITFPFIVAGILFIVSHYLNKKQPSE
jgi:hypothetical protein